MFDYEETAEQATRNAQRALALIDQHGANPNPRNFAIWYSYTASYPPELVRALDILLSNGQSFNEELGRELFERYLGCTKGLLAQGEAGRKLERQVREVIRVLSEAGTGTKAYGKALSKAVTKLAANGGLGQVKDVITSLVSETQAMADRTRKLETQLEEQAKEAEELRRTLESTRRDALTDGLTGLANRKHFDTRLREAVKQAMETGEPLCLLMADIDRFKNFNDTHGHPMGDQVLRLVARTLTMTLKGADTPARYGGEEFVVILPATELAGAHTVAEQIRGRMASRRIVRRDTQQDIGAITLSIGVTEYRMGEALGAFIRRSDTALYSAKRGGRNCVVVMTAHSGQSEAPDDPSDVPQEIGAAPAE